MRRRVNHIYDIRILAIILLIGVLVQSCSTTKLIPDGEYLYNGMRMKMNTPDGEKLPSEMVSDLTTTVNVKPNNAWPLITPYKRNPFPLGLWIYNNWKDSTKGIGGWIYRKLAEAPVLVSDVKADTRLKMMKQVLDNNGYFGSTVSYEVNQGKNQKKAYVDYTINSGEPYLIDSVIYFDDSAPIHHWIDSMAKKSSYLVKGERFCVDSLDAERVRIANALRNRGFYYFSPEYIEFLADSLMTPKAITLKLTLCENTPDIAKLQYKVNDIHTTVLRRSNKRKGTPDTLQTTKGELVVYRPAKLRENLIPSCITFKKGRRFSVRNMDRTQERLSRLGIFQSIQIQATPVDTTAEDPRLDVDITCQFDRPLEASIEANITSKSNSYLGPGLVFGVTSNNLFGGAERFSVQLSGSYEWQTGRGRSSVFNSYEAGLTTSLAFPRLLAPSWIKRTNRELNWTTISLSGDILNRPHYFRMAEVDLGFSYEWNHSRNVVNQFTPFKLTYSKLISSTETFDSIMAQNPAVALSFESQFTPIMSYTYTYDRWLDRAQNNGINFTFTAIEGGNIFWGLWRACGVKGRKELFGMPFSQYVKGSAQLIYTRRVKPLSDQWWVSRLLIGAEHAYGNSSVVPYADQFYIGGANSIRAFTVRTLGPGSYKPDADQVNGYFDQTGTFKLEFNTEYRFPIVSILHGAAFLDAGNIWLLKDDSLRPGGLLQAKTFLKDIAVGTGIGLRVDLSMIVIRGDLGYGLHAPYDTGYGGYFNIPFKKAFAFHLAIGYPF